MSNLRTKLADWLISSAKWLEKRPDEENREPRFVDLAPTDQADEAGVYSAALTEATDNPRVMNIALTGPYGSGKSSIIQSFLKKYDRDVLQISLAAFLPDAASTAGNEGQQGTERSTSTVSRQEIERSILQQMLYGADANRLPLSRFKRIQSPGRWASVASLFTVLGLVACWQLIQKRDAIMSGAYFLPVALGNLSNLLIFVIGAGFLWLVFHRIYIASFGISLKSISLKDIEISPSAVTEESILNRHLDEIIYFFQSTSYDLVVIEDLDRFNNPEIFVTLREINSLVNANAGVKRKVRFLYAIRDDIFVSTDRTKFFEFIIPVIPIINSSNSIDKVLEQGKRLSIDSRLDKQFVREVSRYLNDLRLIQNIFNEYAIYAANLEPEGETNLDATKLLAVLIYKNVFPSDFEKLHRGNGSLAELLQGHDRYIAATEAKLTAEIGRLEAFVEASDRQLPKDLDELRSIYAMALIEVLPDGTASVGANQNSLIPVRGLSKSESLETLLALDNVWISNPYQGLQRMSLGGLAAKLKAGATFAERKALIEDRSAASRSSVAKAIAELRTKLSRIRMMKFNEVLREGSELLDGMFEAFGDNANLARFLAHADVDRDLVLRFLECQTTLLPDIDQVPADYRAAVVEMGRIEPTWENCLRFIGQEEFDPDVLTGFLDRPHAIATLGQHELQTGDAAFPLRKFVVENDALSHQAYKAYLKILPTRFKSFPDGLGAEKRKALVECNRVTFSASTLAQLEDDVALAAAFAACNIDEFFRLEDELDASEDLKQRLLETDITDDSRLRIIRSMDLSVLHEAHALAALVGRILARTGGVVQDMDAEAIRAVVLRSRPLETQITLFNMFQDRLEDAEVRDLLALLPDPMPDIRPGWTTPRIEGSEVNRAFASWLQDRKFISSWKQGGFFDDDIRLNMFRK